MITELRIAIYNYLTNSNDFIALLGDNLYYKRPLNDKTFPYCVFSQSNQNRTIDSTDKFINVMLNFYIYDGSNDVEESTIDSTNIENLILQLDNLLDNKDFTIQNYKLIRIKQNNIIELPTSTNSIFGVRVQYDVTLQITR